MVGTGSDGWGGTGRKRKNADEDLLYENLRRQRIAEEDFVYKEMRRYPPTYEYLRTICDARICVDEYLQYEALWTKICVYQESRYEDLWTNIYADEDSRYEDLGEGAHIAPP